MLIMEKLSETVCKIATSWSGVIYASGEYILNSNVLECGAFSFQSPEHREVPKSMHLILVQFLPCLSRILAVYKQS